MPKSKIIIPIVTRDELVDFPPRTASSDDVFTWIKSRCSETQLDSERGARLSQDYDLNGYALHTTAIPQLMTHLRSMGFGGHTKAIGISKAKNIAGFVLAARRLLAGGQVEGDEYDEEGADENMPPARMLTFEHFAAYTSISDPTAALPARILAEQSAFEIRTTLASEGAPRTCLSLLPSPVFAPMSRKRTAEVAGLDSEDDGYDEEDEDEEESALDSEEDGYYEEHGEEEEPENFNSDDDAEDNGSERETEATAGEDNGSAQGVVEAEEFEICEEEDMIHDEEFLKASLVYHIFVQTLTLFDEYEEMTPLEARIKWGHTPHGYDHYYDADSDDQSRADGEEALEDKNGIDDGLREFVKGEVAAEDPLEENKENEEYGERHGHTKTTSLSRRNKRAKISNAEESDEAGEAGVQEKDGTMCPVGGQLVSLFADSD
ncbi:hypothetical protein ACEPPN_002190 [Leptodophora sp. 'Broadleaf-Isolate-01']